MILADTNILLRLTRSEAGEYPLIKAALQHLRRRATPLCYTSQNLIEFWRVLTRPKTENGFGLPSGRQPIQQQAVVEPRYLCSNLLHK